MKNNLIYVEMIKGITIYFQFDVPFREEVLSELPQIPQSSILILA
jgi:hypothetical protein